MTIGVVMPVYNSADTMDTAVASILQGDYKDVHLVMIDDGSTDSTWTKMMRIKLHDPMRVSAIKFDKNRGVTEALNEGLRLCKSRGYKYIARQDADDISDATRIGKQVGFMEENGLYLSGTWANIFDKDMRLIEKFHPSPDPDMKPWLLKFDYFIHGSCMFRTDILDDIGYYCDDLHFLEDYDLWVRIADKYPIGILKEYLYSLIRTGASVTAEHGQTVWQRSQILRHRWSSKWGIPIPDHDLPNFRTVI